eukprot:TRINITY_DN56552_c0_g1_i1.p2 TRINITY_DN56552_c0_g1~~TRINITY_DN56552_c0_g1_i1.p2  ORF type:complete len:101 (+),score=13.12 TRINITY_DN56552_c0_g1_i1:90-392(+)
MHFGRSGITCATTFATTDAVSRLLLSRLSKTKNGHTSTTDTACRLLLARFPDFQDLQRFSNFQDLQSQNVSKQTDAPGNADSCDSSFPKVREIAVAVAVA